MPKSSDFTQEQLKRYGVPLLTVAQMLTLQTAMDISMTVGDQLTGGSTPATIRTQADEIVSILERTIDTVTAGVEK